MTPDPGDGARSLFYGRRFVIERVSEFLWISLGAVLGANLRYVVNRAAAQWLGTGFPYGTFAVNVAGSFAAGLIGAMVTARLLGRPELVRQIVIVGFLGSLTTFSSFMYETNTLVSDGEWARALANIGLSLVAGMAGVRLGVLLAVRLGGAA